MIITIDGPSGTGKSTLAQSLAKILKFSYCSTGIMYRALAYTRSLLPWKTLPLSEVLMRSPLTFTCTPGEPLQVFLKGKLLTDVLQTQEIANAASLLAQLPEVRVHMQTLQRGYAKLGDCVFEGRDMGSKVFPNAHLKIFLTASSEVRARRRLKDLPLHSRSLEELRDELIQRDQADTQRSLDPLVIPEGAFVIDSSDLTISQVLEKILPLVVDRL